MVITKTLKEYVNETIRKKLEEKNQEIWKEKYDIYETIRDELEAIEAKATEKCIKIMEEKGLVPKEFGYFPYHGNVGYPSPLPHYKDHRVPHGIIYDVSQEVLLKLELDEVPKNQVIDFVNNYDVSKYFTK